MNKVLFKLHSWMALAAFAPLLVISLTGSILVFKHEIDSALMADKVRVNSINQQRISLDSLLKNIHQQYPNTEAVGWAIFQDIDRADLVYVIHHGTSDWQYLLVDQYTGNILAEPQTLDHYLTDWLLALHATLLLDDAGLAITSIVSLLLCFLGITGIILYRKFWTRLFTLRWNSRLIIYFSDLHKMIGIITSPILLILGITGAYWNIAHLVSEVQEHLNNEEHHIVTGRLYNDQLSIETLRHKASKQIAGFETTYISLPYEPNTHFRFWGDVPTNNPLLSQYGSVVHINAQNGDFINATDVRESSALYKIVDSFRRLHFGDFGGLFTRVIWAIIGLAPVILTITGLTIWSIRRKKKQAKQRKLHLATTT